MVGYRLNQWLKAKNCILPLPSKPPQHTNVCFPNITTFSTHYNGLITFPVGQLFCLGSNVLYSMYVLCTLLTSSIWEAYGTSQWLCTRSIYLYHFRLRHWYWVTSTAMFVPVHIMQDWRIRVNKSHKSINRCQYNRNNPKYYATVFLFVCCCAAKTKCLTWMALSW